MVQKCVTLDMFADEAFTNEEVEILDQLPELLGSRVGGIPTPNDFESGLG